MSICFAFDNEGSKDGIGAQVFRIIGVFSLAERYKVGFVNHDILSFDSHPTDNLQTSQRKREFIQEIRGFLDLDSRSCKRNHRQRSLPNYFLFRFLVFFQLWLKLRKLITALKGTHELYIISNPYRFAIKQPNIYEYFRDTRAPLDNSIDQATFKIQMHIRRAAISRNIQAFRFSPTSWYREILLPITEILRERRIPYEIIVHTDVSSSATKMKTAEISFESLTYMKEIGVIINDDSTISLEYENFAVTLGELGNLHVVTEIDPLEAWKIMQYADLLLIGKSTFSFIPALLNQTGTIISPSGFIRGPKSWIFLEEPPNMTLDLANEIVNKWVDSQRGFDTTA